MQRLTSRNRRNTFIGVETDEEPEVEETHATKFKQFGQFVATIVPHTGLVTIYRITSSVKEDALTPRNTISEAEEIDAVGLKKVNQWKLEGARKIKIHRGLLFVLTDKLQAWYLWEHRPSSRKEGLYFKGDVVDFVVTSNEIGGLRVIAGSADKNIRIWDVENFEHVRLVQSFSISKPVKKISCIGSKIVTLCGGEESKADVLMNLFGSIQVWDLQGNAVRVIGPGHGAAVSDIFVGCRRLNHSLMTWSQDGSIMTWKLESNGKTQEVCSGLDVASAPLVRCCYSSSKVTATVVYYRASKQLHIVPASDKSATVPSPKASKRVSRELDLHATGVTHSIEKVVAVSIRHSNIFIAIQVNDTSSKIIRVNMNKSVEYEPIFVAGVITALFAVVKPPHAEKAGKLRFLLLSAPGDKGIRVASWPRRPLSGTASSVVLAHKHGD